MPAEPHAARTGYLVVGSTGGQTWPVAAFASRDRAGERLRALIDWCYARGIDRSQYNRSRGEFVDPDGKLVECPLDPGLRLEADGVLYRVVTCPLDLDEPRDD